MNIHKSAEDYLERILILQKEGNIVKSIDMAHSMNYSKPSISRAMKNLRENGYIEINSSGAIILTDKGLAIAEKMYERHTLLATYFMSLGVSQKTAFIDACKLEHDMSDETFNALKKHAQNNIQQNKK